MPTTIAGYGITDAYTKTEIDTHINSTSNPHSVTKAQVGLGNVENYGIASQAEAEAGTATNKYMTPLRTKEAILQLSPPTDLSTVNSHMADSTIHFTQAQISITESQISDLGSYEPANSNIQAHITTTSGNPHSVTKSDVGLGNVTNDAQIPLSQKGAASGVATLDSNSKLTASQIPDYLKNGLRFIGVAGGPFPYTSLNIGPYTSNMANVEIGSYLIANFANSEVVFTPGYYDPNTGSGVEGHLIINPGDEGDVASPVYLEQGD